MTIITVTISHTELVAIFIKAYINKNMHFVPFTVTKEVAEVCVD